MKTHENAQIEASVFATHASNLLEFSKSIENINFFCVVY